MGFSTKIANLDDLGGVHFWKLSYLFLILLVPLWGIYGVYIYIYYIYIYMLHKVCLKICYTRSDGISYRKLNTAMEKITLYI